MQSSEQILETLKRDGVVIIDGLLDADGISSLQKTMSAKLQYGLWNSPIGYINEENYRLFLEDILTMDENFQRAAIHPTLLPVFKGYLGPNYTLIEAKAWRSLPNEKDFHGWHNDEWYLRSLPTVPPQLKMALYVTDVNSGAFAYVKGTHGQTRHRFWTDDDLKSMQDKIIYCKGKAGTAILFDNSGIHRQSFPILESRDAAFFCYSDPAIPLMEEEIAYYRYHPMHLNAAFLGDLSEEQKRVLGFGNKTLLINWHVRHPRNPKITWCLTKANRVYIFTSGIINRAITKVSRFFGGK